MQAVVMITDLALARRESALPTRWTPSHPSRKYRDTTLELCLHDAKVPCQRFGKALACRERARQDSGKALARRENRNAKRGYGSGAFAGGLGNKPGDLYGIELRAGPVISTLTARTWDVRLARPVTMGGLRRWQSGQTFLRSSKDVGNIGGITCSIRTLCHYGVAPIAVSRSSQRFPSADATPCFFA
jgi:hypothetical protein